MLEIFFFDLILKFLKGSNILQGFVPKSLTIFYLFVIKQISIFSNFSRIIWCFEIFFVS